MSINNRGINKIIAVYRAQRAKERALEASMPVSDSPYRSSRQVAPVLPISHAIAVPARRLRVMRRWWANRQNYLINRWDVAMAAYTMAFDGIRWVFLALIVASVIFAWLEGRSILRGRVLKRRARMHRTLFFKAFGRYPAAC